MRSVLIFNPRSGTAERIKDFLMQLDRKHRCEFRPSSQAEDIRAIAREAVKEGFDRIIVAGGDGTVGQAINGIAPDFDAVQLAVLPFGTGNDLARSLGLAPDKWSIACAEAFSRDVTKIDLIKITSVGSQDVSWCVNVANGGFGGEVAMNIQSVDKKKWGPFAYWMTAIMHLAEMRPYHVQMEVDGKSFEHQALGVAIANGRFVGGGFPIAPEAWLNDGFLDITMIPELPAMELLSLGMSFTLSRNLTDTPVETYRARRVHLNAEPEMPISVDGEPVRRFDATFEVVPEVLSIVAAPDAPAIRRNRE